MTTVYAALAAVMADVDHVAKRDINRAQKFTFRGIDSVLSAVGPALRAHGVIVVPNVLKYEYGEIHVGEKRTPMGHARVTVAYTFYGPEGDSIPTSAPGEAFDSGDKATAKAMSVAFRTVLIQALALPTDEPDPDSQSYERAEPPVDHGAPPLALARARVSRLALQIQPGLAEDERNQWVASELAKRKLLSTSTLDLNKLADEWEQLEVKQ